METHSSILAWRIPWTEEPGGASLVAQMVKCLLTMWETWVRSLGQEDPLEKGMETHSSIHAWLLLCMEACSHLCVILSFQVPATGPFWSSESESESEVTQSCPTLCDPWTVAHQAPPSMGFSRQEYWSGLPFPSPEDLPNPGIEPRSPTLQADALTSAPPGKPYDRFNYYNI